MFCSQRSNSDVSYLLYKGWRTVIKYPCTYHSTVSRWNMKTYTPRELDVRNSITMSTKLNTWLPRVITALLWTEQIQYVLLVITSVILSWCLKLRLSTLAECLYFNTEFWSRNPARDSRNILVFASPKLILSAFVIAMVIICQWQPTIKCIISTGLVTQHGFTRLQWLLP